MSGGEIFLIIVAIFVPLVIAIMVTLWTLQPAVIRAERAKRAKRRAARSAPPETTESPVEEQT